MTMFFIAIFYIFQIHPILIKALLITFSLVFFPLLLLKSFLLFLGVGFTLEGVGSIFFIVFIRFIGEYYFYNAQR